MDDHLIMNGDIDGLTGFLNEQGLERRTKGRDWGWFVAADLDAPGDATLLEFARFLTENTRQRANRARDVLAARTGGDEFTVRTETRSGAERIVEAIRAWASKDGEVTSSAGMGNTIEHAVGALYSDKLYRKGVQ